MSFFQDVKKFNEMYGLDTKNEPINLGVDRLTKFVSILDEEVEECTAIAEEMEISSNSAVLTMMADWLGDIIVYCASEAGRWGIPIEDVLKIIMDSNLSKLGEDGKPIFDARGKLMKGPNYWKPEEKIGQLLEGLKK